MLDRRKSLGGFLPSRRTTAAAASRRPRALKTAGKGSGKQHVATTMALVRIFWICCATRRSATASYRSSPTRHAPSAWTAGSRRSRSTTATGSCTSVDADLMLAYKESAQGQILHEGINEGRVDGLFIAVGTSYATHDEPMIPLYIFYSMFGFQRTGDNFWAAGDQMARGFVIGATAGRTTLTGEGLQHADGHSHLLASTNPSVVAYDPAFAFELGHIIADGLTRMYGMPGKHLLLHHRLHNEPILQPAQPADVDVAGLLKGIYRYAAAPVGKKYPGQHPGIRDHHARRAAGRSSCSPTSGMWARPCTR